MEGAASLSQTRAHASILPEHRLLTLLARFQTAICRPLDREAMRERGAMTLSPYYGVETRISEEWGPGGQPLASMAVGNRPRRQQLDWQEETGIGMNFNDGYEGETK